jgi:hypothetical protein
VFLDECAQTERGVGFNIASLVNLFELTCSRVHTVRVKAANISRAPHRPFAISPSHHLALSNEQQSELCLIIHEKVLADNNETKMEFLNYIKEYFRISLTYGWIRCFLQR